MNVLVTGKEGFIGRHVVAWLVSHGHQLNEEKPDALIDLAWTGLPNYESPEQLNNTVVRLAFLEKWIERGVTNITGIGTCLENTPVSTPYATGKMAVRCGLAQMLPTFKWVQLYYPYGTGQRKSSLWPRLRAALARGETEFHVIDGARDFLPVQAVAGHICRIALQTEITGIIEVCSGVATPVIDFCRRFANDRINLIADYPIPAYEPQSFHGSPEKLLHIA